MIHTLPSTYYGDNYKKTHVHDEEKDRILFKIHNNTYYQSYIDNEYYVYEDNRGGDCGSSICKMSIDGMRNNYNRAMQDHPDSIFERCSDLDQIICGWCNKQKHQQHIAVQSLS